MALILLKLWALPSPTQTEDFAFRELITDDRPTYEEHPVVDHDRCVSISLHNLFRLMARPADESKISVMLYVLLFDTQNVATSLVEAPAQIRAMRWQSRKVIVAASVSRLSSDPSGFERFFTTDPKCEDAGGMPVPLDRSQLAKMRSTCFHSDCCLVIKLSSSTQGMKEHIDHVTN